MPACDLHAPEAKADDATYVCVACAEPVASLYVKYADPTNTSLLQCPHCGSLADVYQSLPRPILLLDLLLLKRDVYRHLLWNRGGDAQGARQRYRRILALKLAVVTVGVDALVRCTGIETASEVQALLLFAQAFGYCLLETSCLLVCTMIAAMIVAGRPHLRLAQLEAVPLTAFAASVPTIFFLVVSSVIWRAEYLPSPANSDGIFALLSPLDELYRSHAADRSTSTAAISPALVFLASYSRANLKSGLAQIGAARGWASEAVLRKGIGGASALVAFSVLLQSTKRRAAAVLLLAWLLHLFLLHTIDPFLL